MTGTSPAPGWWLASDGRWYAPELHPDLPDPPGGPSDEAPPTRRWNGIAIAALVLGCLAIVPIVGIFTGLVAIVLGIVAMVQTSRASETQRGFVMATAGVVIALPLMVASAALTVPVSHSATVVVPASPGATDAPTATTAPTPAAPTVPGFNQVAEDGDFAFTVTGMQCGVTSVGVDGFSKQAPAGSQWCLVTMNVANDKTSSQTFFASNQKAIDAQGNQLDADTAALIYMPNDSSAVFAQVNPGVSITAVVPFQISTSDSIASFELHDSAFSGGVTVNVT